MAIFRLMSHPPQMANFPPFIFLHLDRHFIHASYIIKSIRELVAAEIIQASIVASAIRSDKKIKSTKSARPTQNPPLLVPSTLTKSQPPHPHIDHTVPKNLRAMERKFWSHLEPALPLRAGIGLGSYPGLCFYCIYISHLCLIFDTNIIATYFSIRVKTNTERNSTPKKSHSLTLSPTIHQNKQTNNLENPQHHFTTTYHFSNPHDIQ